MNLSFWVGNDVRRETKDWCIITLVIAALIVAFMSILYIDMRRKVDLSYCPDGNWVQRRHGFVVPGHTAIIIDTSNRIPTEARVGFDSAIAVWTQQAAPMLQRLSVYGLPESVGERAESAAQSFCIPKRGREANILYENPVFVEGQFRRFLARLDSTLAELIDLEEADQSPIAEAMADLRDRHGDIDSFVLVSDMLQNTPMWSHYSQHGDSAMVDATCGRIARIGDPKTVDVYYIDRELPSVQAARWPDEWWAKCLHGIETRMLNGLGSSDR